MTAQDLKSQITARPTLSAWLAEYEAIGREFCESLERQGVLFEAYEGCRESTNKLLERLRTLGARFLNEGLSVSSGFLSSACRACATDAGSRTFYINLKCPRNCYYCFNVNQAGWAVHSANDAPWREQLEAFGSQCDHVSHIGLTGGEPLLFKGETESFFDMANALYPGAHTRLYTSGFGIDDKCCRMLAKTGLKEIRFSIKIEDGKSAVEEAFRAIELAKRYIPDVMVEMPVIPGNVERMKQLLVDLDKQRVRGINLLEFCFPLHNWPEFAKRGFRVKNPPFEVFYNYGYAGGLPVAESERDCLELLLFAIENGLEMGVHYCSLANKNIGQLLMANKAAGLDERLFMIGDDGFAKVCKVYDCDASVARRKLEMIGAPYAVEEDGCVCFHCEYADAVRATGAVVATSYNASELRNGSWVMRELKLDVE